MKKIFFSLILLGLTGMSAGCQANIASKSGPEKEAGYAPTSTEQLDMSDWLVYRNEEYGFETKYPASWKVINNNDNSVMFIEVDNVILNIKFDRTSVNNIDEWFQNEFSNRLQKSVPKLTSVVISNLPAYFYTDPVSIGGCGENYILLRNNILYQIIRQENTCNLGKEIFESLLGSIVIK